MKAYKILLPLAVAFAAILPARAQLLGTARPTTIAYDHVTLTDETLGAEYKSQFGIALGRTRTFTLGPALLGMLRFGVDATWMDLSYAKFKKGAELPALDDDASGDLVEGLVNRVELGKHRLAYNVGVGPCVKFTPLSKLPVPVLKGLKVGAYIHWKPGYQLLMFSGDKLKVSHGVMANNFGVGVNISLARVGIGYEYIWGRSKLNNWQYESRKADDIPAAGDVDSPLQNDKRIDYKNSTSRIYVGFWF